MIRKEHIHQKNRTEPITVYVTDNRESIIPTIKHIRSDGDVERKFNLLSKIFRSGSSNGE